MTDPLQSRGAARLITLAMPLVLALAALSSPALAEPDKVHRITVEVADLDLGSAAGRATLDQRLDAAFRIVCRVPFTSSVRARAKSRECIDAKRQEYAPLRNAAVAEAQARAQNSGLGLARNPQ